MSDPPRLRDLPDESFARDLLRAAAPTPAMRPDDALRLAPVAAKIATGASLPAALLANYGIYAILALGLASAGALGARALRPASPAAAPAAVDASPAPAPAPLAVRATVSPRHVETLAAQSIPPPSRSALTPAGPPPPPTVIAAAAPPPPAALTPTPRAASLPSSPLPSTEVVAPRPDPLPLVGGGSGAPAAPPRDPTLAEELSLLRSARGALRESPAQAVSVLTEGARRFPGGQMRDDREALLIEALLQAGRRDDAARRLRALAATNASGAQVARLRAMLQNTP